MSIPWTLQMVWGTPYLWHLSSQTSLGKEIFFGNKSGKIAVRAIIWMGKCFSCLTGEKNQGGKTLTLQEKLLRKCYGAVRFQSFCFCTKLHQAVNPIREKVALVAGTALQHLHSLWIHLGHRFIDFLIVDSWGSLAVWRSDSHSPCTQPDRGTGEFLLPGWCFLWSK